MKRKVIIEGESAISKFIPQRFPIIMIDKFFGIEGNDSYSGLSINAENIFCESGFLQEAGIIEHIAQSAAVRIGYLKSINKDPINIGYIGSIDKLKIHKLPKEGNNIFTTISIIQEIINISLVEARVESEGEEIANCRLKIFLKENEDEK